jgi:SAM-dependent methyltransferase
MFGDRLRLGVGVDYEHTYVAEARRRVAARHLHFVTSDATAVPIGASFDLATSMTNTWGTMSDKAGVLSEMRRLAPRPRSRLLSVYAEASVLPRREWYRRLGHPVVEESNEFLMSEGGFRSEHFSEARLRSLVGDCVIYPLAGIAHLVIF